MDVFLALGSMIQMETGFVSNIFKIIIVYIFFLASPWGGKPFFKRLNQILSLLKNNDGDRIDPL